MRAALAVVLCAAPAQAFRPFTTDDAGVAAPRRVELEAGWDASFQRDRSKEHLQQTTLNVGIPGGLEASVDVPLYARGPEAQGDRSGLGDVVGGVKWAVLPEAAGRPGLALSAKLKTDSGDPGRGLGSGEKDWSFGAAVSRTMGGSSAHLMAGHGLLGSRFNPLRRDAWFWGAGADWALSGRWSLLAETFGQASEEPGRPAQAALRAGSILSFGPDLHWDLSAVHGLTRSTPRWTLAAGLTRAF